MCGHSCDCYSCDCCVRECAVTVVIVVYESVRLQLWLLQLWLLQLWLLCTRVCGHSYGCCVPERAVTIVIVVYESVRLQLWLLQLWFLCTRVCGHSYDCCVPECAVTIMIVVCLRKQQSWKNCGPASQFDLKREEMQQELWSNDSSFWGKLCDPVWYVTRMECSLMTTTDENIAWPWGLILRKEKWLSVELVSFWGLHFVQFICNLRVHTIC